MLFVHCSAAGLYTRCAGLCTVFMRSPGFTSHDLGPQSKYADFHSSHPPSHDQAPAAFHGSSDQNIRWKAAKLPAGSKMCKHLLHSPYVQPLAIRGYSWKTYCNIVGFQTLYPLCCEINMPEPPLPIYMQSYSKSVLFHKKSYWYFSRLFPQCSRQSPVFGKLT